MQQWLAFPWIRYAIWLISGVLLAHLVPGWEGVALWIGSLISIIFLGAAWYFKKNKPAEQLLWGLLAFALLICFGYWRTDYVLRPVQAIDIAQDYWYIQVEETPAETVRSHRFIGMLRSEQSQQLKISAIVYLPKDQPKPALGQVLFVRGRVQAVPAPLNPHEFDYRAYLASQHIHYQAFVQASLALAEEAQISFWHKTAQQSRDYLLGVVSQFVASPEAAGVVKAMVLGERSALDHSLRQAYANAGVMHVLAVSGLHVGMVFFLMNLAYRPLQRKRWQRLLWMVLTLSVLWCYAWLTGLAPSAQRASVMFSIIAIGQALQRRGNIYNSIGISAFILLVLDPLLIRQVGFQLSYLAVLGIVYLQPRISRLYQPGQSWIKKIWELFSVSLAAQLATFPLGLFYFHQFPTYFFVGNLLAVPLAFIILYSTLALMALHWVPLLGKAIGWLVNLFVLGLNEWVRLTESLPLSKIIATITAPETVILYCCMLAIILMFRLRSFGLGMVSFLLLLLLAISGLMRTYTLRTQQHLTIYQIPGHTLLHFVSGQQEVVLPVGDAPSPQQLSFHVAPARIQHGLPPIKEDQGLPQDFAVAQSEHKGLRILVWQGKRIAVLENALPAEVSLSRDTIDILLLRNSPAISLEKVMAQLAPRIVVVDASNSRSYREQIKSKANLLLLPLHITSEQGAYQQPL